MKISWAVEDNYTGADRIHSIAIPDEEILDCEDDAEIEDLVMDYVYEDFQANISSVVLNLDEALKLKESKCQS